jgi:predicted NBD/HSP70 family sugar kinase
VQTSAAESATSVPADVRLANLGRVVRELRSAGPLSRAEVARRSGVSVATGHRLISDLAESGLVQEQGVTGGPARLGRPPVVYRFRDDAALLAAADVGNETTRLAVTTLAGRALASCSLSSDHLDDGLAAALAGRFAEPAAQAGSAGGTGGAGEAGAGGTGGAGEAGAGGTARADHAERPLAGAGIGIASAVDADGVLHAPPLHQTWDGLPLRESLAELLGCQVSVAQDDHLSPVAESSEAGTFPGASSLLVLEIGRGIGVGMTLDGVPVSGAGQRFGRIAGWPVGNPPEPGHPLPGTTLGECLVAGGLVSQYRAAGGTPDVCDGAALAIAARGGDELAGAVFAWAAREIADLVVRLHLLCDPEAVVIGGGLARSYDLLEPAISAAARPRRIRVARSILSDQAVIAGAVLAASSLAQGWLTDRLARA